MSIFQVEKRNPGAEKPNKLRNRGLLPIALVERSHVTLPLQGEIAELRHALAHLDSHGRMELNIQGEKKSRRAIVKQIDQDPLRHGLIHLTLQEVADDDMVRVDVPVLAIGHSADTEAAGITLQTITDHVKVKGRVKDIPERIEVDVSSLHTGEHISAGDIALPEGIELISPPDATLFTIAIIRAVALEPATEEEPEETADTGETTEE